MTSRLGEEREKGDGVGTFTTLNWLYVTSHACSIYIYMCIDLCV